ncbi:galactokinase [Actinacidiphila yanglinensis]|uniref:Galactokinase n=1 Tax=Actinacidiphila yanglinensis TaxID=310779 RepID=A0A1H5ZGP8_9ACTN|nr:galactokinase [Actinacidiphila yanglinensis]SEG35431.1 galactokinase [Actinacidiphila yanglinensis]
MTDDSTFEAAFKDVFGGAPEGAWAAPGRVNLIGEHTDYNDGYVMPFALPHITRAAIARRDDGLLRLRSADMDDGTVELAVADLAPGTTPGWVRYPAAVLWSLRQAGHDIGGADILYDSTVPVGGGLSSSAALQVVTALALTELHGVEGLSRQDLALLCQSSENTYVGAPVGVMDQTASACCTDGHALHLDVRGLVGRQVPLDLSAEGLRLLVVDTRVKHSHADGAYGERRAGCEAAAAALGVAALRDVPHDGLAAALAALAALPDDRLRRLTRHVVTENRRVEEVLDLCEAGRLRDIGPVLTAGHASLRDDFQVSCPELDLVVDTALAAGALGARMTGGGFGGSAIVLIEADDEQRIGAAVSAALPQSRQFVTTPSAGARRLW